MLRKINDVDVFFKLKKNVSFRFAPVSCLLSFPEHWRIGVHAFCLFSNGEIISSAIFCTNVASDGKLGERSVAGYTTADALSVRTRDG